MTEPKYLFCLFAIALSVSHSGTAAGQATSDFATTVVDYVPGTGVGVDWITGDSFDDPFTALGRPTVDTTGDMWTAPASQAVAVVPVYPALRSFEVVTIGTGGRLTLAFDHPVENDPRNPCNLDFIVFGNPLHSGSGFWQHGDPNSMTIPSAGLTSEATLVSVSQDGVNWVSFVDGPYADDFAPTLGRRYDPDNADPALIGNQWWGQATDPTIPVNPAWTGTDFVGLTVAQYAMRYGYSSGGTGFDLDDVGLDWIQYVRIDNANGSMAPEIDAVSDVAAVLFPDFDCDADVDSDDVDAFNSCSSGPGVAVTMPYCHRADLDSDGDVDQSDFGLLQRCISGSDIVADRSCLID